jgi:hypothetical protein
MNTRSLTRCAAALGIALASLAACGGDDDGSTASTDSPVATSAAPITTAAAEPTTSAAATTDAATTTAAGPAPTTAPATAPATAHAGHDEPIVRVGLVDYAFGGLPASVPVGTELQVTNGSTAELHELVAFRLPETEQRPVAELVALPPEEIEPLLGVPTMVLIAPPGEEGFAVLGDGTLAEPGRYVIVCAIPVGADPQEFLDAAATSDGPPQVAGGPPHFTQGMFAELMVEG